MMIQEFEEHPEFMHRILSEYYILKPQYIKLEAADKEKGLKKKSKA
jgi:hypothetical protein